ncbi:sensor histidine kinase [Archaeoglobus profundus]|uniref:PAS/PAC sensor signal transduction histidine kinase n=1 Tax=Archaeoglobus profundus (strain DSM 5631 / JCM 9629 / NBRC 100127 / Av18) TaxID=572546 RepID=D2RH29_ARCPA|nr:PAS domain-containing sensor histidine kinase [Archaeoglobus profundus]ADB57604.1 PAS/PAC sensor signal transduction histidine kinase [Archaeoglobus profundus DSM 5631]
MLDQLKKYGHTLPVPFLVYNEKGEIVYANSAFLELVGMTSEEVLGKNILDLVHPEDKERARDAMKKRLAGERVEPYFLRLIGTQGKCRTYMVVGGTIKIMGKNFGIITFTDVTKLEEQKLMLLILTRALRHDVLNAVTVAMAHLEVAKDLCRDCEKSDFLQKIEKAINRVVEIMRSLKAFEEAVLEGKLERICVREVAESVAKHFDVPIVVEGDCEAIADRGLEIVFENLFQNAIQHGRTDRIDVKISRVGDFCEIRVIDYGKGIPDEIKDRIFEESFSYGETASSGQGLYLVKKLVERYGGEIWVEDNEPKGAVFVIMLKAWSEES